MERIDVRLARPADLEALLRLYEELADGRLTAAPTDRTASAPVLAEILTDPMRRLVVAVWEGGIVGTADLLVVANLTHHAKPWALVENVVVATAARRSGIGRALMTDLIDRARAAGCYKLQLISGKQRSGAHAFYRSLGLNAVAKIYYDA